MRYLSFVALALLLSAMRTDKPAYQLFDQRGNSCSYRELLKKARQSDVVFFGELHDNPICHWLELELTKDLFDETEGKLALGAEMFESDNQVVLDEFTTGLIKDKNFEADARLWPNYKSDYKPLVSFAREKKLPFVATNVPRRYAAMVNSGGFESLNKLSASALGYMAPLPVVFDSTLSGYAEMIEMAKGMPGHAGANIAKAQALKDATMAYFIHQNVKSGHTFLHFNGSYHTENWQGIVWYLKRLEPSLNILTIASATQDQIDKPDSTHVNKADFLLLVPETMSRTQ